MAAVGSGVCSLAAIPISLLSASCGKGPAITLGALSLGSIGVVYLVLGNEKVRRRRRRRCWRYIMMMVKEKLLGALQVDEGGE
jgi:hypothetical protein